MMTTGRDTVPVELYGTWRQLSGTLVEVESGLAKDGLSSAPNGHVSFSPDGRIMLLSIDTTRPRPATSVPTAAEAEALFRSMIAYAGWFSVEGNRIFYDLDASWNESWTGTRQERYWEIREGRLIVSTPEIVNPITGKLSVHRLTFEKVRSR
jgi:hypothetical protein